MVQAGGGFDKVRVDRVFALEEIVEAFQYQETNTHFGKICLKI